MIVFLNGEFVPEEQAVVSVFDRGFLYGDGLFETMRVSRGKLFCWRQHLERLGRGAAYLKLRMPFSPEELQTYATQLIQRNQMLESLLRITLSRGIGPRGYSFRGAESPFLVMSLHPAPALDSEHPLKWRLMTTPVRLAAGEALAQFKTCNKLPQILARAEAEAHGADEGLLLNTAGEVAEAGSSNLFWVQNGIVCTPALASGILAGVTRAIVLELCHQLGLPAREVGIRPKELAQAEGVFLSLSSLGVVEAVALDGHSLRQSPLVPRIRAAYHERITRETGEAG